MLRAALGLSKSKSRSKGDDGANDDLQLILLCQNGDREAQHQLYHQHKDTVFSIAYRMTNNQQEAEDLAQMAFVRIFRKIGSFRGDSALSS
ncbi:MAG: RNA polymerase sigma factor [bacterium]